MSYSGAQPDAESCYQVGHTALVYRTAATASGLVASASEDNSVRLWSADGQCLQTIPHPGALLLLLWWSCHDYSTWKQAE